MSKITHLGKTPAFNSWGSSESLRLSVHDDPGFNLDLFEDAWDEEVYDLNDEDFVFEDDDDF